MNWTTHIKAAALARMLLPGNAAADEITLPYEYGKTIKTAEVVGSLGPDAFGDRTNFYTGSTEFTVTDIDLPGPGLVPVRLGRRYVVEYKAENPGHSSYPFANWQIDIPHLHGTFARTIGWNYPSGRRCSLLRLVPPDVRSQNTWFGGTEYWNGNHVYIPGVGSREMLRYVESQHGTAPSSGGPYRWSIEDQWFSAAFPTWQTALFTAGRAFWLSTRKNKISL